MSKSDIGSDIENVIDWLNSVAIKQVSEYKYLFTLLIFKKVFQKFKKQSFLEKLLKSSELAQINLLWTSLQPVTHRDYFYSGKYEYPEFDFKKLSTPITRDLVILA